MVSRWSNFPILTARNGQIKVWPLYMEHPISDVVSDIVMGGCAPVIAILSGTSSFCYFPSSVETVDLNGDALIVVTAGGLLCVDYKVPPIGAITGGQAQITVTLGGTTSFCYFPSNGVTMGGEADVIFTARDKQRGGKGVPYFRRKRQSQATHFYFKAEAFFENTLQIGGGAYAEFRPAPYQFIKSLPKVQIPDPKRDSEFVDLFKRKLAEPRTTTFTYSAAGGITAKGTADDEYFDFHGFLLAHDEELILSDVLSDDGFPIITTVFDHKLQQQKREEDELLHILDVL